MSALHEIIGWTGIELRLPLSLYILVNMFNEIELHKILTILTYLPWTEWPPFPRRHSPMHFRDWKVLYFFANLTKICS